MERAAEVFALVTMVVVGLSHVSRPGDWCRVFATLHGLGTTGAFVNGAISLVPGALFVAAHQVWSGPGVVLTVLGWLLVVKGAICFLAPEAGLRSMGRAAEGDGRPFVIGGAVLLAVAAVIAYARFAA